VASQHTPSFRGARSANPESSSLRKGLDSEFRPT
jgi:hypothetical protein